MKIRTGYLKDGNCWRFKPELNKYWSNKLLWFSFWRFFCVFDFRDNWVEDMMLKTDKRTNSGSGIQV